jgi:SAM-dependent methyltransferase
MTDLRASFESAADTYERARPPYPRELFDELIELAGLEPPASLLEIGCATGKATRPLAERGFRIVCVELGPRLAAQARTNLVGLPVEIHLAPFEGWQAGSQRYELVFAANAWHWLDPAVRYRKAHELLRPGGHLAFWDALHAFPVGFDPFFTEIQEVYDSIGESWTGDWPPPPPELIPDQASEIEATGLFDRVDVRRYRWETRYSADQYIALLETFSGHLAMEPSERAHLYAEIRERIGRRANPTVLRDWCATLHVARRAQAS